MQLFGPRRAGGPAQDCSATTAPCSACGSRSAPRPRESASSLLGVLLGPLKSYHTRFGRIIIRDYGPILLLSLWLLRLLILWSHIPSRAAVSSTPTIPQNDIQNYLGPSILFVVPPQLATVNFKDGRAICGMNMRFHKGII